MKKTLTATLVVFIAWLVLDFLIHGVILRAGYAATPGLWRGPAEAKVPVYILTVLIGAYCFCRIYSFWIQPKSVQTGFRYGIWFGVAAGVAMGYGTYAFQPIPYYMALTWFLGRTVETIAGGILAGALIKE